MAGVVVGTGAAASSSSLLCPLRRTTLVVDKDEGAGLRLEPCEEGMLVEEVEKFPGQRGIAEGDIIAVVDGQSLRYRDTGGEEATEDLFVKTYRDGVVVLVLENTKDPVGVVRFRCPRCWRGYASWEPCLRHMTVGWRQEMEVKNDALDETALPPGHEIRQWMQRAGAAAVGELPRPTKAMLSSGPGAAAVQQAAAPEPVLRRTLESQSNKWPAAMNSAPSVCRETEEDTRKQAAGESGQATTSGGEEDNDSSSDDEEVVLFARDTQAAERPSAAEKEPELPESKPAAALQRSTIAPEQESGGEDTATPPEDVDEEERQRLLEEAEEELADAAGQDDAESLQRAIAKAERLGVSDDLLEEAREGLRELLDTCSEEQREAKRALDWAVRIRDIELLTQAIERARIYAVDDDVVQKAGLLLKTLQEERKQQQAYFDAAKTKTAATGGSSAKRDGTDGKSSVVVGGGGAGSRDLTARAAAAKARAAAVQAVRPPVQLSEEGAEPEQKKAGAPVAVAQLSTSKEEEQEEGPVVANRKDEKSRVPLAEATPQQSEAPAQAASNESASAALAAKLSSPPPSPGQSTRKLSPRAVVLPTAAPSYSEMSITPAVASNAAPIPLNALPVQEATGRKSPEPRGGSQTCGSIAEEAEVSESSSPQEQISHAAVGPAAEEEEEEEAPPSKESATWNSKQTRRHGWLETGKCFYDRRAPMHAEPPPAREAAAQKPEAATRRSSCPPSSAAFDYDVQQHQQQAASGRPGRAGIQAEDPQKNNQEPREERQGEYAGRGSERQWTSQAAWRGRSAPRTRSASRAARARSISIRAQRPPPPERTWWARHFVLQRLRARGAGAVVLRVNLARMHLRDADVPSMLGGLDALLEDLRAELAVDVSGCIPLRVTLEVDLSENALGDAGAVCFFRWLLASQAEVRCRVLRLGRNKLGDDALLWLAECVRAQHSAFQEVHLSQNRVSQLGAGALLLSMSSHPSDAYPWQNRRGLFLPAWVTLDGNRIFEPEKFCAELKKQGGMRICRPEANSGGKGKQAHCLLQSCRSQSRKFALAPHVHLPELKILAVRLNGTRASDAEIPADIWKRLEDVKQGGTWSPPEASGKLELCIVQGSNAETLPATMERPLGPPRREHLLVDEDCGAGIELEPVDDGMLVTEILRYPGQPGLRVGEVIAAVDGWPLSARACRDGEDAQNERFGSCFRHGACLDVVGVLQRSVAPAAVNGLSNRKVPFRCPQCWTGFDNWPPCLDHLRSSGHLPERRDNDRGVRREDEAACLRRWMNECISAAHDRGRLREQPVTNQRQDSKLQGMLVRAGLANGMRCRALLDDLVRDVLQCGDRYRSTIWIQEEGLEVLSMDYVEMQAAAEELQNLLKFYLPERRVDVGGAAPPGRKSPWVIPAPSPKAASELESWVECMVQQCEEAYAAQDEEPDDEKDGNNSAMTGSGSTLNIAAPPFVPQNLAVRVSRIRLLLLCGLPGSGKSTIAAKLREQFGWQVVNQDSLGSRQACMKAAREVLSSQTANGLPGKLVVDRCNVDKSQRSIWVQLATEEFGLGALELACVWLDVREDECGRRVLKRFDHKTLAADASSLRVIRGFADTFEPPSNREGFARVWRIASPLDAEVFWSQLASATAEEEVAGPTSAKDLAGGVGAGVSEDNLYKVGSWQLALEAAQQLLRPREKKPRPPLEGELPSGKAASAAAAGRSRKLRELAAECLEDELRSTMDSGEPLPLAALLECAELRAMLASAEDLVEAFESHPVWEVVPGRAAERGEGTAAAAASFVLRERPAQALPEGIVLPLPDIPRSAPSSSEKVISETLQQSSYRFHSCGEEWRRGRRCKDGDSTQVMCLDESSYSWAPWHFPKLAEMVAVEGRAGSSSGTTANAEVLPPRPGPGRAAPAALESCDGTAKAANGPPVSPVFGSDFWRLPLLDGSSNGEVTGDSPNEEQGHRDQSKDVDSADADAARTACPEPACIEESTSRQGSGGGLGFWSVPLPDLDDSDLD
eukprot:TRINITY_DN6010_c0_g2_i1.p1 TRINITY_DN6010_c0_g2~~TRINITY_DN6010_c0_g2_i1.p1  ORF type:complete len:2002 (-),score=499.81 TRINITY_DN6010_c0_g2_i1:260-6265(-)